MTTPAHTTYNGPFRGYTINNEWFIGVTSLIKATLAEPAGLAHWKQGKFANLVLDARAEHDGVVIDREHIIAQARQADRGSGPEAELGTAVHKTIEDYEANADMVIDDPKQLAFLNQWLRLKTTFGLNVNWTERTLVNTELGYAGTADGLLHAQLSLYGIPYRDSFIYDIKTGKGVYDTYALQLALLSRCDAMVNEYGDLVSIDESWNRDFALVAKLGPRSAHLYTIDINTAWDYARVLPDLYEWRLGAGEDTIRKVPVPQVSVDERRVELLERARQLDSEAQHAIKASWDTTWPKLTEPDWDPDTLAAVDELIANAERGAVA